MKINKFASASVAILLLSSTTPLVTAVNVSAVTTQPSQGAQGADIASGVDGTCAWRLDASGALHIGAGTLAHLNRTSTWDTNKSQITKVIFDGKVNAAPNGASLFAHMPNLISFENMDNFNTSDVTSMTSMFDGDGALTSLDLSHFDTSKVTSMKQVFGGTTALTSLDLSHFDTSKVTSMIGMFSGATALTSLDLSHFDTSEVVSMNGMFSGAVALKSLDLSSFDTSKVTNFTGMFNGTPALASITLGRNFVGSSTMSFPVPPNNAPNIGEWENGTHHFADLISNYNGATMSGTWTWAQDETTLTLKSTAPALYVGETWDAKANIQEVKDAHGQSVAVNQVTISGTVDTTTPGTYPVTYSYGGKTQTAQVTVAAHVSDLSDLNVKDSTIYTGETWNKSDNFVNAKNTFGRSVDLSQVTVTGTVNTDVPGTYTITYTYGNIAQTAHVIVVANQTDLKVKNTTITAGSAWNKSDNFVSARDKVGHSVGLSQVTVTGTVNTRVPGTYTLTYAYGGKTAKAVVTVKAKSTNTNTNTANTSSKPVASEVQAVYRLYNKNSGEHFYTVSAFEKDSLVKGGWNYEGIGWSAPTQGTAVYRVYNPNVKGGDHYYTASQYEAQSLVKAGWKWDNGGKPVFYSGGKTPVYVAFNPNAKASGSHNYTSNSFEQNSLLKNGWKFGKVQFYGK